MITYKLYKLPLTYDKKECCVTKELKSDNYIKLYYAEDAELLTYDMPNCENEITVYSIPQDEMDAVTGIYDNDGKLKKIQISTNNRLIYIRYDNYEEAKQSILDFVNKEYDIICNKIINKKQKLARLFTEYFYDGQAVDIAVKPATPEDVQNVINHYGNDSAVKNSGDYPFENRMQIDTDTLAVMLSCAHTKDDNECNLFYMSVNILNSMIEEKVIGAIDKTDDFDFISEEYD